MSPARVAVIADLVKSKSIVDRKTAQHSILSAFSSIDNRIEHIHPLRATVGDEFQAVYPSVATALEATMLARLALPEGIDCRFGLGRGEIIDVGDSGRGVIQDGSGWWLARDALNEAHRREDARTPSLRGWFRADENNAGIESLVNAYLLTRDHIIGSMSGRARRITLGSMLGASQGELAEVEGITQSAVSQALRRSGGTNLAAALHELRPVFV